MGSMYSVQCPGNGIETSCQGFVDVDLNLENLTNAQVSHIGKEEGHTTLNLTEAQAKANGFINESGKLSERGRRSDFEQDEKSNLFHMDVHLPSCDECGRNG